nr:methionyl-tRNA formyltransferase [uncultured Solibaculum sp.]
MNIVFMGTPDFAVPCLQALLDAGHTVSGVVTQPDKPKGRKYILTPPPVKVLAEEKGIPVYQPTSLKQEDSWEPIKAWNPDLIAVVAYGKILPKAILNLPRYGCINVHASLLPRHRGAAPIQWSILMGDKETGVTTMQMAEGLDTGDMLLKCSTPIDPQETAGQLHDRLMGMGANLLVETVERIQKGNIVPQKQDDSLSTYASMLSKSMCPIDWTKEAQEIHNQIRGLSPWPTATTLLEGKTLKVHASMVDGSCKGEPGEIAKVNPLTIACGDGKGLKLLEVQYEGGKRMPADAFLRGHPVKIGMVLGR